jgi:hypothetical protein
MGLEIPVLGSVTQTDLSFAFLSQYLIADLPIEYCRVASEIQSSLLRMRATRLSMIFCEYRIFYHSM